MFRQLAERTSPSHVQWRFDPILLTSETTPQDVADRFRHIASALEGYTRRCYVSFATLYRKAARRLAEQGIKVIDPPLAPDKKTKPKRSQMVMLSFVVALFIGIFMAFFLEFLEKQNIHIDAGRWPLIRRLSGWKRG